MGPARWQVLLQVLWQWLSLVCQVGVAWEATGLLVAAYEGTLASAQVAQGAALIALFALARVGLDRLYVGAGYRASADVKRVLRGAIFAKLLRLGASYREQTASSEVVQMATEGVEQLETYFSRYLSQLLYAVLAPLTLFAVLLPYERRAAVALLVAVPLIPVVIMVVMMVARRLLDRYFQVYYGLGDSFLEKLNGLTTLKVYQADQQAADEMDEESERFRKVTMKVLGMQLNSTVVMDVVAFGGAAVGMVCACQDLFAGAVGLRAALLTILLGAEFFLPMRLLGSYFHIGMNGMKAADKIFALLDLPEPGLEGRELPAGPLSLRMDDVTFSWDGARQVLDHVSLAVPAGSLVSVVGVSGSGKSTIAALLTGRARGYGGRIEADGVELADASEASLLGHVTLVSHDSYLLAGTVRENLLMARPGASDEELEAALAEVRLLDFVRAQGGLDMALDEGGSNLSGGQRQRLALARALLADTAGYVLDEATSNIDQESEEAIMAVVRRLARTRGKTVLLISHRLANVVDSDRIYLLADGHVAEQGTHGELMAAGGAYARLFSAQRELEGYARARGGEA